MKEDKDILAKIGHRDGMTVPEGYFADFAARMADSLEKTPFEESTTSPIKPQTMWQRIRPYVYLAAMFAGVWCMLKMFTMFTATPDTGFTPSPVLAEALGNDIFVSEYLMEDLDQWSLMDEMMENGVDVKTIFLNPSDIDNDQFQSL